ncbi:hypothetical protein JCM10207_002662 [Rhodosporidiobolus poonsookiae]
MVKLPAFDPTATKHWLISTLEPISDAEPAVLADYVLALLKHDVDLDEMRAMCTNQLDDFLDKHTPKFVDDLLRHLQQPSPSAVKSEPVDRDRKPALPLPPTPSSSSAAPSASSASKRSADDAFPSSAANQRRRTSASGTARGGAIPTGPASERNGQGQQGQGQGQQGDKPPCRDYHFRGFCARGDACPYKHDSSSIPVPLNASSQSSSNQPQRGPGPQGPFGGPGGPPFGFPPGAFPPGAFPPGAFPFAAAAAAAAMQQQQNGGGMRGPGGPGGPGPAFAQQQQQQAFAQQQGFGGPPGRGGRGGGRGGRGGMRGGAAGGGFGAPTVKGRGTSRLIGVDNIPPSSLTETAVRHFFAPFGTISRLELDVGGSRAVVGFDRPRGADRAVSSPQAVFGNRFVRVYRLEDPELPEEMRYRPRGAGGDGEGADEEDNDGMDVDAASAALPPSATPPAPATGRPYAPRPRPPHSGPSLAQQLALNATAQRTLLAKLDAASAPEMAGVRKILMQEMRRLSGEGEEIKKRIAAAAEGGEGGGEGEKMDEDGKEEDPRARLEKLRKEAASLGIDPSAPSSSAPQHRAYKPYPRPPHAPVRRAPGAFKLDNRSSSIVVSPFPGQEALEGVRKYFEGFGEVTEAKVVKSEGEGEGQGQEGVVTFKTRREAEKAMAAGSHLPSLGQVSLRWSGTPFTPTAPPPPTAGHGAGHGALLNGAASAGVKLEITDSDSEVDGGARRRPERGDDEV